MMNLAFVVDTEANSESKGEEQRGGKKEASGREILVNITWFEKKRGNGGRNGEADGGVRLTSGNHFSLTFSNEAGEVTEKQTKKTSV